MKKMFGKENPSICWDERRWSNKKEEKLFADEDEKNNIIISQNIQMSLDSNVSQRNLNTICIGGAGAGKTRSFMIPNIMQMNSSYVITDVKGLLFRMMGKMLADNGYEILLLNLMELEHSCGYNFFEYIHGEEDILKIVTLFIDGTDYKRERDNFFDKAEHTLLSAIISHVWMDMPEEMKNMKTVINLLSRQLEFLDEEFEMLEKKKGSNHFPCIMYRTFNMGTEKMKNNVQISLAVRLSVFNIKPIQALTQTDTLHLDKLGDKKTALFIVKQDTDTSMNFLVSMLYSQILDELRYQETQRGKLPIHVRCMMDEFVNTTYIPGISKTLAEMGKSVSVDIMLQGLSQLKRMYPEAWEGICARFDTFIFLGGSDYQTLEHVSKKIGILCEERIVKNWLGLRKKTVIKRMVNNEELIRMSSENCIVFIRGMYPYYTQKYQPEKHKMYDCICQNFADENDKNFYPYKKIFITENDSKE